MAAVTDSDILARLDALKINHEMIVEHPHSESVEEWNGHLSQNNELKGKEFALSKTLLFKPKQPKSATPTPVLIVAKNTTPTNSSAIGKLLNMKDLRLAADELVKDVLPGCQGKGGCESPLIESLIMLLGLESHGLVHPISISLLAPFSSRSYSQHFD